MNGAISALVCCNQESAPSNDQNKVCCCSVGGPIQVGAACIRKRNLTDLQRIVILVGVDGEVLGLDMLDACVLKLSFPS